VTLWCPVSFSLRSAAVSFINGKGCEKVRFNALRLRDTRAENPFLRTLKKPRPFIPSLFCARFIDICINFLYFVSQLSDEKFYSSVLFIATRKFPAALFEMLLDKAKGLSPIGVQRPRSFASVHKTSIKMNSKCEVARTSDPSLGTTAIRILDI
jgi:hypothetical protein